MCVCDEKSHSDENIYDTFIFPGLVTTPDQSLPDDPLLGRLPEGDDNDAFHEGAQMRILIWNCDQNSRTALITLHDVEAYCCIDDMR